MTFAFDWVENVVGKGENAGYQRFLLFPQSFHEAFYSGSLKSRLRGKELNCILSCNIIEIILKTMLNTI